MYRRIAIVLALATAVGAGARSAQAQDWRTVTSFRQYKGEDALRVSVEYGAGRLLVAPGQANALYKATLRYDATRFRPVTQYQDNHLRIGVEGGSIKGRNLKSGQLDLAIGTSVPLELDLKFGAVQAEMELGGLRIREARIATGASETHINVSKSNPEKCTRFDIDVGAAEFDARGLGNLNCETIDVDGGVGDVTLDFNGAWRVDANVSIDMGLGSLTLRVPRGLGVQVRKDGFLASFDSQGLIKRGDVYYSENWESATKRASFKINAAFGAIRVVWVEPEAEFRRAQR
ncbi:MAG: toast rack family protein [Gemmatimonadota bacterium]